ncbi:hypothetical protein [Bradyrhizobium sp. Ash2021]|uniref:hypothetical protein n=1 Tax=Bradyrhizobium sp. Ash2021 TaxID=2954771 RepID=UPI00281663B3|nr:hypothetical protein [Bradyrhizobium sp. Ash2021]WMT72577.1 hypothetical protein NL528_31770 [Bradyrhizobium sp. Ash2021]
MTFLLSLFYLFSRIGFGLDWPEGFATTTVLLLFGISLNAIFLGIIGEYVGRIYAQVRFRPTTVIEQSTNIDAMGQALRRIETIDRGMSGRVQ